MSTHLDSLVRFLRANAKWIDSGKPEAASRMLKAIADAFEKHREKYWRCFWFITDWNLDMREVKKE